MLFVLVAISIFCHSEKMVDAYIVPKWCYTLSALLLILIYLSIKHLIVKQYNHIINLLDISRIVLLLCLTLSIWGILQYIEWLPSFSAFKVVGNYDNPAGFAATLSISFPLVWYLLKNTTKQAERIIAYIVIVAMTVAVLLSASRAGIVTIAIWFGMLAYDKIELPNYVKKTASVLLAIALFVVVYALKKDSADGRVLIWRCALAMISDSPYVGYGWGGFKANYMDYQACYFEQNPNSPYAMLADNVQSPFNEYLNVLINWGVIGFLIIASGFVYLFYIHHKHPTSKSKVAITSIITIAVFSLFSYPFTYPYPWLILIISIAVIINECVKINVSHGKLATLFCLTILFASSILLHEVVTRIEAEYKWKSILYRNDDYALKAYKELNQELGSDPYFLYSYAVNLYQQGCIDASLEVANACDKYWADYDLQLLLGTIYHDKLMYDDAIHHYKRAALMCPNRFIPLEKLMDVYMTCGKRSDCYQIALTILEKPVKVPSINMQIIKRKAKGIINQMLNEKDTIM